MNRWKSNLIFNDLHPLSRLYWTRLKRKNPGLGRVRPKLRLELSKDLDNIEKAMWVFDCLSRLLLKYPHFDCFLYFHGENKYKIRISAHCSINTKKLINTKVGKGSIFALKCTFLGQNRLSIYKFVFTW